MSVLSSRVDDVGSLCHAMDLGFNSNQLLAWVSPGKKYLLCVYGLRHEERMKECSSALRISHGVAAVF